MGISSHRIVSSTPADTAQHKALQEVSRTILETPLGGRLPNISQMRANVGVGAGTMQKAMQEIQRSGDVELSSKQRQGTILIDRDMGALWATAGLPPLTVLLPLPHSRELQGLATGLRREIHDRGIPTTFLYGHGSWQRINALRSGTSQICVMSAGAARHCTHSDDAVGARTLLRAGSYYAADSVLVLARAARERLPERWRIGIDRDSADHVHLTETEFPRHTFVDIGYPQIPAALRRGMIDAAVWHHTTMGASLEDESFVSWPLARADARTLGDGNTSAALVIRSRDDVAREVLSEMDTQKAESLQHDVIAGDLMPLL